MRWFHLVRHIITWQSWSYLSASKIEYASAPRLPPNPYAAPINFIQISSKAIYLNKFIEHNLPRSVLWSDVKSQRTRTACTDLIEMELLRFMAIRTHFQQKTTENGIENKRTYLLPSSISYWLGLGLRLLLCFCFSKLRPYFLMLCHWHLSPFLSFSSFRQYVHRLLEYVVYLCAHAQARHTCFFVFVRSFFGSIFFVSFARIWIVSRSMIYGTVHKP